MRVLVTGGTGYLGSAIVRALLRRGHEPIVFARTASRTAQGGTPFDGDVRDAAALARAAQQADAICHTAALVTVWRRRAADFDDVNVQGLRNALDAARQTGIRRFVYTSSFLALPPSDDPEALFGNDYQRTKRIALEVARAAAARGAPVVITIPGVIYGPGVASEGNLVGGLIRDHLRGRLPGLVGADRRWSYAWVDDVADAHVAALERGERRAYRRGPDQRQRRPTRRLCRRSRRGSLSCLHCVPHLVARRRQSRRSHACRHFRPQDRDPARL